MSGKEQSESRKPPIEVQTNFLPTIDSQQALHDSLDTTQLKAELDSIRQSKIPPTEKSQKELEIVKTIREEMQSFRFCGSTITEFLLQELDIKYLKLEDSHQKLETLIIVTADDTLTRLDNQEILTDENIRNQNTSNILALSQKNKTKSLVFWVGEELKKISIPQRLTFNNLGTIAEILYEKRCDEECIKVCRKLTRIFPKKDNIYHLMLGNSLIFNKQFDEETVNLAYQGIQSNPEYPGFYLILGDALANKPESPSLKKAIWAFEEFIKKAKGKKNWEKHILETQEIINYLEDLAKMNEFKAILQPQETKKCFDSPGQSDPN